MPEELSSYAVSQDNSKGRSLPSEPHRYRAGFERDRDRIIHCEAFRRLEGKTQVFTPGLNDNYRNRLTHSIEVAQIGRTIAKALSLNESLTEAICLAHDLGHPPFGHRGEVVLSDLMSEFGGFEHNRQTLRIVDLLEHPYPDFVGLNLMYETRLGLAKHHSPYDEPKDDTFEEVNCSLEGQVADVADRIAYNCHDLEDAMRAGLINAQQLTKINIFAEAQNRINAGKIAELNVRGIRTAKAIIDSLVSDAIDTSKKKITQAGIKTVQDVYCCSENFVMLSVEAEAKLVAFEKFLLENVYLHSSLQQTIRKVEGWVRRLFDALCRKPGLMPAYFQKLTATEGLQRTVCDYIAGMTDRFCLKMLKNATVFTEAVHRMP